jgi:hypothetical protein
MATEILVNDGGAPARILPFTAGATVSGGHVVTMQADGKLDPAGAADLNTLGVAFVDATDTNNMSVITGRGVIVNAYVTGSSLGSGALLEVGATAGDLRPRSTADAGVAVLLEAVNSGTPALYKVLLI